MMDQTYRALAQFAQTWGLAFFVVQFLVVLAYTFWPASKQTFDDAARMPLRED